MKNTALLPFLQVFLLWSFLARQQFIRAAPVSEDDRLLYAAAGHPMFVQKPLTEDLGSDEAAFHDGEEHERVLQNGCTQRVVAVYESAYDVDFKDGDFQIGVTPIYKPSNLQDAIGNWWWDWAVFRGTNYERSYGTMMIEYNPRESLTFGFSVTQSYYPISGGYLTTNQCPGGYATFQQQDGDVRYYMLYICKGC